MIVNKHIIKIKIILIIKKITYNLDLDYIDNKQTYIYNQDLDYLDLKKHINNQDLDYIDN